MILFVGMMLIPMMAFAAADLPTWHVNESMRTEQTVAASGTIASPEATGTFNATLNVQASQWVVSEIGTKSRVNCGAYNAYVLSFDNCTMAGTGHANISVPIIFDADIRLDNGTVSGEIWIKADDLSPMYYSLSAHANVSAYLFNQWVDLGTADITNISIEFCDFMKDFEWPLDVGKNWSTNVNAFITGHVAVDLVVLGIPFQTAMDFDAQQSFGFAGGCTGMESMNGCNSYKSVLNNSAGSGQMTNHYCPAFMWYAKKSLTGFHFEDAVEGYSFDVSEITWNVLEAYRSPTPTPAGTSTPTPTPTGTQTTQMVDIKLSKTMFYPNDQFLLTLDVNNSGSNMTADTFIILEVLGMYYFWDGWTQDFDFRSEMYPAGLTSKTIFDFPWPSGAGTLTEGLAFYGALFQPGLIDVEHMYGLDSVSFGFQE